ncbi:MAG: hypothetical protein WD557_02110 [Dehalococcoidia bacterium]
MRWSKVRKLVEDSFADSVRGRVTVHGTTYSSYTTCKCGRGWIAFDGKDRADMQSLLQWPTYQAKGAATNRWGQPTIEPGDRHEGCLVEPGEFTREQLFEACFEYIHSNPHTCLESTNPLIRSLAVLNGKVGTNRLKALAQADDLHPLTQFLLEFRMEAEGSAPAKPAPVVNPV